MAFLTRRFEVDSLGTREDVTEGIRKRYVHINGIHEGRTNSRRQEAGQFLATRKDQKGSLATKWISKAGQSPVATDEEREIAEIWRHLHKHQPSKSNSTITVEESAQYSRERRVSLFEKGLPTKGPIKHLETPSFITENTIMRDPNEKRLMMSRDGYTPVTFPRHPPGEPLIEMNGVKVQYGDKAVLGDWKQEHEGTERKGLWWTVSRGQRWGVFGPNGKSSTLSMTDQRLNFTQDRARQP
jgi:hypothetical protein